MSSDLDFIFGNKKKKKTKEPTMEDMFNNLNNNFKSFKSSPAVQMSTKAIKKFQKKRGMKKAKVKVFRDTLRTKPMKPRKIKRRPGQTRQQVDHFVF